ncbi:LysM peptidoglycan-binding domain-containing protein [Corallincola luteus]|uniref:LysM peptidoglycan-binding domain-containing protein n=4 Tax=Psychromonadaceae TaxID=267894 RepID=A0A368NR45_9GAMM|nr:MULTISPECIES: peptidoglycan DD-metalloendopeptidase family protein [Corallincola]RCU51949.1 LysM peptidoglycan-binding domain-containing protein [Corallincola holothuriorum]TAA47638.1 LysM peptidoglycan-binding domain-containing protein [Corallincola spongiicola]TCI05620.1 LysM peptidoglycan-binding domain-containing protein [Corallincola luteus]
MNAYIEQLPKQHKVLVAIISVITLLLLFMPAEDASASRNTEASLELGKRYPLPLEIAPVDDAVQQQANQPAPLPELSWQTFTVKSGDSLAKIFQRAGFSPRTLHNIANLGDSTKALKKIHPGDQLKFGADRDGQLIQLVYPQDKINTLTVTRYDDTYVAEQHAKQVETRTNFAAATITSNFYNAGVDAGLSPNQIMSLATIFGWDVDFALDLRKGDSFSVMYEERFADGEMVGEGAIVAAEFINQGDSFQAVRHTDGVYYSPDGKAMKKAFLRAPVNFKYISSSFNPRRLHPVTGKVRAHNGIDYAAKTGTPVMAAGDGRVTKSGYNKLNGNYVFIKHGEGVITKYLHLHKRHVKTNARVKQGQKIGTVGATGRVTGAHLHYEFLVNGVHRNPRTVKLPDAKPIKASDKKSFIAHAETMISQLNANRRLLLAMQQG